MSAKEFFRIATCLSFLFLVACSEQPGESTSTQPASKSNADLLKLAAVSSSTDIPMDIYKSPTCGCCVEWAEHVEQRGFSFKTHHPSNLNQVKNDLGIAPQYRSCHTAVTAQGYIFEGHVPARYIQQFMALPPKDAIGLAVPDMPVGSPGMEMNNRFEPYQVLLLKSDGSSELYADITNPSQQY